MVCVCVRLTFWWLVPLLRLGYNVPLEQSDLSPLPGAEHVKAIEPSTELQEVLQCPDQRMPQHYQLWLSLALHAR